MSAGRGNLEDPERLVSNKSKEKREMLSSHQKWLLQNPSASGKAKVRRYLWRSGRAFSAELQNLDFYAIGCGNHGKIPCQGLCEQIFLRKVTNRKRNWMWSFRTWEWVECTWERRWGKCSSVIQIRNGEWGFELTQEQLEWGEEDNIKKKLNYHG